MGFAELQAALEQEGAARVAAIRREAEAEAARLREAARKSAARRRAEQLERAEAELRREAHARVADARKAARREVLAARGALLERVFERASSELARALGAPAARPWLEARIAEALAYLPGGKARVIAADAVADVLEEVLAEREDVRVERDPGLPGGFRASSADGAVVVDASVASLIEQARASLAPEVAGRFASLRASPGSGST